MSTRALAGLRTARAVKTAKPMKRTSATSPVTSNRWAARVCAERMSASACSVRLVCKSAACRVRQHRFPHGPQLAFRLRFDGAGHHAVHHRRHLHQIVVHLVFEASEHLRACFVLGQIAQFAEYRPRLVHVGAVTLQGFLFRLEKVGAHAQGHEQDGPLEFSQGVRERRHLMIIELPDLRTFPLVELDDQDDDQHDQEQHEKAEGQPLADADVGLLRRRSGIGMLAATEQAMTGATVSKCSASRNGRHSASPKKATPSVSVACSR